MKVLFDYDENNNLVLAGVFDDEPLVPEGFEGLVVEAPLNRKFSKSGKKLMGIRMNFHQTQDDPAWVYMPEELLD